jgi:hypothetical protein
MNNKNTTAILMKNVDVEPNRIPMLEISFPIAELDGKVRKFYLCPYRGYGFQVVENQQGDCAIGIIVGSLRGVCEAVGMYKAETIASLAYAGFSEWWERRSTYTQGIEKPSFSLFNRDHIFHYANEQEEINHHELQAFLEDCEKWIMR